MGTAITREDIKAALLGRLIQDGQADNIADIIIQKMIDKDACYGKSAKAGLGEPLFVLRAQDKAAPAVVRVWHDLAVGLGLDPDRLKAKWAIQQADKMEQWAKEHGSKVPD